MNNMEWEILSILKTKPSASQRNIASLAGCSLGRVHKAIQCLTRNGYIDSKRKLTAKTKEAFQANKPRNAIILAAGFGMRMLPINNEVPKGLLVVRGDILIERLIQQLHVAGINQISIVVGFMRESYEYLIDKYGVELVVNTEYASKNNLHSLKLLVNNISNTYILPCDIWCSNNPFRENELYSWYMMTDEITKDSTYRVKRNFEIVKTKENGNQPVGVSYIAQIDAAEIVDKLIKCSDDTAYNEAFWEDAIFLNASMLLKARVVSCDSVYEINTYEQLRRVDHESKHLNHAVIRIIEKTLGVSFEDIKNINVLKKGMTNCSLSFTCKGKDYVFRIPSEGKSELINRSEEYKVYEAIKETNVSDVVLLFDPITGYKISEYLHSARVCDPNCMTDVARCMSFLKSFHDLKLRVDHNFDLFERIDFYESLWGGKTSCYIDYQQTKQNVLHLKEYIDRQEKDRTLCHIDSVPDNFLFVNEEDNESIHLIDWEYAAMQDPHVDIAMFAIYALYDRKQINKLIESYLGNEFSEKIKLKIYCYIAVCGLLWSNWCEYKRFLGVEFGEYSLRQYRYAKDYYRIFMEENRNDQCR